MLAEALWSEAEECIARFADERDERGHRLVVRNGSHEPREVLTSFANTEIGCSPRQASSTARWRNSGG